jgi:hypothetical protein
MSAEERNIFHHFIALPDETKLDMADFMDWNDVLRLCRTSKANRAFCVGYLLRAFQRRWGPRKTVERRGKSDEQYINAILRQHRMESAVLRERRQAWHWGDIEEFVGLLDPNGLPEDNEDIADFRFLNLGSVTFRFLEKAWNWGFRRGVESLLHYEESPEDVKKFLLSKGVRPKRLPHPSAAKALLRLADELGISLVFPQGLDAFHQFGRELEDPPTAFDWLLHPDAHVYGFREDNKIDFLAQPLLEYILESPEEAFAFIQDLEEETQRAFGRHLPYRPIKRLLLDYLDESPDELEAFVEGLRSQARTGRNL